MLVLLVGRLVAMALVWASLAMIPVRAQDMKATYLGGTLNVVLANKNGIVIATDSMLTDHATGKPRPYNGQKLFRTGERSALAIAGFAAGTAGGSPLDLVIESVLRRRFGAHGIPDERGGPGMTAQWSRAALRDPITGASSLFDPESLPPNQMALFVTVVGFDKEGKASMNRILFRGSWKDAPFSGAKIPEFQVESWTDGLDNRFIAMTVGVDCIARSILSGSYRSKDPIVLKYYAKLRLDDRDSMTLAEMESLVRVILRETRKTLHFVGRADQVAVIPARGVAHWALPVLQSDRKLLPRFFLKRSFKYNKEGVLQGQGSTMSHFEDFQRELDEPIAHFFLGNGFSEVPIVLDHNYFVGNSFESVRFQYQGGPFFARRNTYQHCIIEIPHGVELPESSELSGKCEILRTEQVVFDEKAVGFPIKWEAQGCVSRNSDGTITLTGGGKCGKTFGLQGPIIKP